LNQSHSFSFRVFCPAVRRTDTCVAPYWCQTILFISAFVRLQPLVRDVPVLPAFCPILTNPFKSLSSDVIKPNASSPEFLPTTNDPSSRLAHNPIIFFALSSSTFKTPITYSRGQVSSGDLGVAWMAMTGVASNMANKATLCQALQARAQGNKCLISQQSASRNHCSRQVEVKVLHPRSLDRRISPIMVRMAIQNNNHTQLRQYRVVAYSIRQRIRQVLVDSSSSNSSSLSSLSNLSRYHRSSIRHIKE
jgi:hypothetical protein